MRTADDLEDETLRAAFERDEHTCQVCETAGDADALGVHRPWTTQAESPHEATLVTICRACRGLLEGGGDAAAENDRERFLALRAFTVAQSEAIGAVVDLAQASVGYVSDLHGDRDRIDGEDLETDVIDGELVDGGSTHPDAAGEATTTEAAATYRAARRRVDTVLAVLAGRLEALDWGDGRSDEDEEPLAAFREAATALCDALEAVTTAADRLVGSLERCPVCLEPAPSSEAEGRADEGRCRRCGSAVRRPREEANAAESSTVEARLEAIDDALSRASATTERVAACANAAATVLVGENE